MIERIDISVVIPVHALENKEEKKMLLDALKSIANQKGGMPERVVLVYTEAVAPQITKMAKSIEAIIGVTYLINNSGDTTFQGQVNFAMGVVDTKWFTVLEFDDEMTDIYTTYLSNYLGVYDGVKEAAMLLPIIANVTRGGELVKYGNEVLWVNDFSANLGQMTHECLKNYEDFNLTGCAIRTDVFKEVGMLKASMKVSFNHEFLLRLTQFDYYGVSIPKVLYLHNIDRENSLYRSYIKAGSALSGEEVNFWFNLARTEYVFKEDRKLVYGAVAQ